jgi:hypothetical protein
VHVRLIGIIECYEIFARGIDLEIWFGTTYAVENCHDIWNLEYEENLQARVSAERCKRIGGVQGVKWDKCGTESADSYIFCMVKGTKIII